MLPTCEKCGSQEFEVRWQGLTYEFRCARCLWGCCTTRFPPIQEDEGPYSIIVTSLGQIPVRALVALNRRFTHGMRRTRELFTTGEQRLFTGNAYSVWQEAQRLLAEGVPFRIDPAYPYDLATYDPEHDHEHEWITVTDTQHE